MAQIYFEDVQEGGDLPSLEKCPSTQSLVRWAGASGDYYQIHYDKDFAQSTGLAGVIVHGALKGAYLGQMLGDFAGEKGWVKKYGVSYRGMDVPNDKLTCKGKITKKYVEGSEHLVDCEIWLENSSGTKTTLGTAVVMLPSKG